MAFVLRSPSPNAPVPGPSTPGQVFKSRITPRLTGAGEALFNTLPGVALVGAGLQAKRNWLEDSPTVEIDVKQLLGWRSGEYACKLKVNGMPVPDGIVLTHETVRSPMEYRSQSITESALYSTVVDLKIDSRGYTTPYLVTRRTDTLALKSELEAEAVRTNVALSAQIAKEGLNRAEAAAKITNAMKARLDEYSQRLTDEQQGKAVEKLRKVHVGDLLPRQLELRFVVLDVQSEQAFLKTRFDMLDQLIRMFCKNPLLKEKALAPLEGKLLTAAARITAEAAAGRLVRLSGPGVDPYGVDTWVTTQFQHRQVPDSDMVFVQVILHEYESFFKDGLPEPVPEKTLPADDLRREPPKPEPVTRPAYTGWAAFP